MHIRSKHIRPLILLAVMLLSVMPIVAQSALDVIESNPEFSASDYCIYPDSDFEALTPAPKGMKPFYISHYGRHGSRYLNNYKAYDFPYEVLLKADSLGKLTVEGMQAYEVARAVIEDSEDRWGDLTETGQHQQQHIAHRMIANFPEVFKGKAFIDAHSTMLTRCVLSMSDAVLQMTSERPDLQVELHASFGDQNYLNHQDRLLRDSMMNYRAQKAFDEFSDKRWHNPRLMQMLFNDTAYVRQHVDEKWLGYYLLKTALIQQNTGMRKHEGLLLNLFTSEDIHQYWQQENVWWYITYGPSPLTYGLQPYSQCTLLRKMIEDADSIIAGSRHGATLRFGHGTVILPLACLLGLNGYDQQIDDLEQLEEKGWWASKVFPMASNIQFVFYRKNKKDKDVIFKILLNEKEAMLPIPSDIAPYYRWSDFREYYLQRIADAESALSRERNRIHAHLLNHGE